MSRALADCEKRWIVNRIVDRAEEQAIIDLLERHGQIYLRIPFVEADYDRIGWNIACFPRSHVPAVSARSGEIGRLMAEARSRHDKNAYVMNNNGARNVALRTGRSVAKWVLPWDGNCFLTESGWAEIRDAVLAQPYLKYFIVPDGALDRQRPTCLRRAIGQPSSMSRKSCSAATPTKSSTRTTSTAAGRRYPCCGASGCPGPWDDWTMRPVGSAQARAFDGGAPVRDLRLGQSAGVGPADAGRL